MPLDLCISDRSLIASMVVLPLLVGRRGFARLRTWLLLAALPASKAYVYSWPTSDDGGCGVLVSNRKQDDGMAGSGYVVSSVPTQSVTAVNGVATITPVFPGGAVVSGWFATVESGELEGGSTTTPSSCSRFSYKADSTASTITWRLPTGAAAGTYRLEIGYAPCVGQISYYAVSVTVESPPVTASPPPPRHPLTTPSPLTPSPLTPSPAPVLTCVTGQIMDIFCINRGTLLDNSRVRTLENPAAHSVHCLVDVPSCYNSGYEVLTPPAAGSNLWTRFAKLDASSNSEIIELARANGACGTCIGGYGNGKQSSGFQATIIGVMDHSTSPPTLVTTGGGGAGAFLSSQSCPPAMMSPPPPPQASPPPKPSPAPAPPPPVSYERSEVPGYTFQHSPPEASHDFTVHWALVDGVEGDGGSRSRSRRFLRALQSSSSSASSSAPTALRMLVTARRSSGWLGVGFSASAAGTMVGSDAVIGWSDGTVSGTSLEFYALGGYNVGSIRRIPAILTNASITRTQTDGADPFALYSMEFTRPLCVRESGAERCIEPSAQMTLLWAFGEQDRLETHSQRGAFPLLLSGLGETSDLEVPEISKRRLAHGVCMLIGWGVLIPIGASVASGKVWVGNPRWFHIHRVAQSVGLLVALAGFIIALTHFQRDLGSHAQLGWVVMVLGLLQPLNGVRRPKKGAPLRLVWEAAHKGLGWLAIVLAAPTIALGIRLFDHLSGTHYPDAPAALGVTYAVVAGVSVLVALAAYARKLMGGSEAQGNAADTTATSANTGAVPMMENVVVKDDAARKGRV